MESKENVNRTKTEYFRKMYKAHETIAAISERIDQLYSSATLISPLNDGMPRNPDPKRFERIVCEITDLRSIAETLLIQRARFDVFLCSLNAEHSKILGLRCKDGMSWYEIASALKISSRSAKDIYSKICDNLNIDDCTLQR